MRIWNVLLKNVILFVLYFIFFADNTDSFAAVHVGWFHYKQIFVFIHFSLLFPPFVSLWQNICHRTYVVLFTQSPVLFGYVPPHCGFVSKIIDPNEVVHFLKFIHCVQIFYFDRSFPLEIGILILVVDFKATGAHGHFYANCSKLRAVRHPYGLFFHLIFLKRALNL